jgi:hypothetical protein
MWWSNDYIYDNKSSNIAMRDNWAIKFPIEKRADSWAKAWSTWANKTRHEVIVMTNDLPSIGQYQLKLKWKKRQV